MLACRRTLLVVAAAAAASCKSAPDVAIEVTTGQESGALAIDPSVAKLTILATSPDGSVDVTASAKPGGAFDMGEVADDQIVTFCVTGADASGNIVAAGRSIGVDIGALAAGTLPIFVERFGGFSRPDGGLSTTHMHAPAAALAERYVLLAGGDSAENAAGAAKTTHIDTYDLLAQQGADGGSDLPRSPKTIVVRGTKVLLIDDDGATLTDFDAEGGNAEDVMPPDGLAFADVAGGQVVEGEDGTSYVVGATRSDNPTAAVLVVDDSGNLSQRTLTAPRAGAAAAYLTGKGLFVAGGSAEAAGLELVPSDGSSSTPLAFAADSTSGAGLSVQPNDFLLLAGGVIAGTKAPTRFLSLDCATDCAAQPVDGADVDTLAAHTQAFKVNGGALLVGDDLNDETRAFLVAPSAASGSRVAELPLRDKRKGATAIATPNGLLAVLGGELDAGGPALTVELLFPAASNPCCKSTTCN